MPNYVSNMIKMKGITALPLFEKDKETGEKYFDFNKLIPMPESLDIESGSHTDDSIVYFLTNRLSVKINELSVSDIALVIKLVNNMFDKNWADNVFERLQEKISHMSEKKKTECTKMAVHMLTTI